MPATLFDNLLPTITWTLVHSLWQGAILTVLAGLALLLTRHTTAALRYAVLCTLFFLFLGGVCITFLMEWRGGMEPTAQTHMATGQAGSFSFLLIDHWRQGLALFLNQNAHWIVQAWMLVLLFQLGRMVSEVVYIRKLRNRSTWAAGPLWMAKAKALAEELGIRKTVLLVESAVVKVPIVIGHFKPLVMVPVGMLNHLSPGEVEAVLLHELAHIRRHDYLVNYLQRITETLLFFNPGVLWVSSLLRAEREACCDEMAISRTGNKRQFVEALIRCKEHAMQTPGFSLGLFGNRNALLHRLNRIVSNRNKALSSLEAAFFGMSILVVTLLLAGWNERTKPVKTVSPVRMATSDHFTKEILIPIPGFQKEIAQVATSNKPAPAVSSGRRVIQRKKQETREVVADIINVDQQLPGVNNNSLQQMVVQLDDRQTAKRDAQRQEAEKMRAQADWRRVQAEIAHHQAEIDRALAESHRKQADRDRVQVALFREQAQKDRLRAGRDRVEVQKLREDVNRHRGPAIVQ